MTRVTSLALLILQPPSHSNAGPGCIASSYFHTQARTHALLPSLSRLYAARHARAARTHARTSAARLNAPAELRGRYRHPGHKRRHQARAGGGAGGRPPLRIGTLVEKRLSRCSGPARAMSVCARCLARALAHACVYKHQMAGVRRRSGIHRPPAPCTRKIEGRRLHWPVLDEPGMISFVLPYTSFHIRLPQCCGVLLQIVAIHHRRRRSHRDPADASFIDIVSSHG